MGAASHASAIASSSMTRAGTARRRSRGGASSASSSTSRARCAQLRRRGVRRVVVAGGSMGAMSSLVAAASIPTASRRRRCRLARVVEVPRPRSAARRAEAERAGHLHRRGGGRPVRERRANAARRDGLGSQAARRRRGEEPRPFARVRARPCARPRADRSIPARAHDVVKIAAAFTVAVLACGCASDGSDQAAPIRTGWERVEPGGATSCARGGAYAYWLRRGDPEKRRRLLPGRRRVLQRGRPASRAARGSTTGSTQRTIPAYHGGDARARRSGEPVPRLVVRLHPLLHRRRPHRRRASSTTAPSSSSSAAGRTRTRRSSTPSASSDPDAVLVTGCSAGSVGSAWHAEDVIRAWPERARHAGRRLARVPVPPADPADGLGDEQALPVVLPGRRRALDDGAVRDAADARVPGRHVRPLQPRERQRSGGVLRGGRRATRSTSARGCARSRRGSSSCRTTARTSRAGPTTARSRRTSSRSLRVEGVAAQRLGARPRRRPRRRLPDLPRLNGEGAVAGPLVTPRLECRATRRRSRRCPARRRGARRRCRGRRSR